MINVNPKQQVGSFFVNSVYAVRVNIPSEEYSYLELREDINKFVAIQKVYVDGSLENPTEKQLTRLLGALSNDLREIKLCTTQNIKISRRT